MFQKIRRFLSRLRPRPIDQWYRVRYDNKQITIEAEPPGREAWIHELTWESIERVIFQAEGLELSDGVYLFTTERSESYVVPTEAHGGIEFWQEIIHRGLFDPELAIQAATSTGGTFIWPPIDEDCGQQQ